MCGVQPECTLHRISKSLIRHMKDIQTVAKGVVTNEIILTFTQKIFSNEGIRPKQCKNRRQGQGYDSAA